MVDSFKKINLNFWLFATLAIVILASLIIVSINFLRVNLTLNGKIALAEEIKRPAEVEAIIVKESSCVECVDVAPILEKIKQNNVNIKSIKTVERMSEEGDGLIKKYSLEKIPSFILTGEIDKGEFLKKILPALGEIKDNAFILKNIGGPFVAVADGQIKGKAKLILLTDSTCPQCYDAVVHQAIVKQFGLNPTIETVDSQSLVGKKFISAYRIQLLPTIIIQGDLGVYPQLKTVWPQVGDIAKDGAYVFRQGVKGMGVYHDLASNKIIEPQKK
ncbi:MAG: hypothetical protein HZC05_02490 [Candidatus Magasanikbacteria bacterium]|nr:hypothetical protein [Candidatus Magasanikbacteria bacterium]